MEALLITGVGLIIIAQLHFLKRKNAHFMSNTSQTLQQIAAQLSKAKVEIVGKIQALTDAVNNNQDSLSPDSLAALADLQAVAQQLDDIVPDAPAEPPTTEPTA